jgi:putative component of membrane protein insertase Oxa1/YidC/SpoIIIJ protein YidD
MIAHVLIFIITGLRPLFGPDLCKFPETCTRYAVRQLKQETLFKALIAITKRVASCSPINRL